MAEESPKIALVPTNRWEAESLRVTGFPSATAEFKETSWWQELMGEPPDKRLSTPKTSSLQEHGSLEGNSLVLNISPLRIDWVLSPNLDTIGMSQHFPRLGSFNDSLRPFASLVQGWLGLETCPQLNRLAFGCVLLLHVESLQQGYEQLAAYLPAIDLSIGRSSDFLYQINRPRESTVDVPNLRINRLSRWSVSKWRTGIFGVTSGKIDSKMTPERFGCRIELDINSAPDFSGTFSREQSNKLLEELITLAFEIVEKGDIE
jgi:hypothetical protein